MYKYRDLPKYPVCVIEGKEINERQASEVILRTSPMIALHPQGDTWSRMVYRTLGIEFTVQEYTRRVKGNKYRNHSQSFADDKSVEEAEHVFRTLNIGYFSNKDQIDGGQWPEEAGWCHWNGTVGSGHYTVKGKWVNIGPMLDEWKLIAQVFPFLRLTVQLWRPYYSTREYYNSYGQDTDTLPDKPLGHEFIIRDGSAHHRYTQQCDTWTKPYRRNDYDKDGNYLFPPDRPTTWVRLHRAVQHVREQNRRTEFYA